MPASSRNQIQHHSPMQTSQMALAIHHTRMSKRTKPANKGRPTYRKANHMAFDVIRGASAEMP